MIRLGMTILNLLLGGWLLFDGAKALSTGDYTTPKKGEYAGKLGPWSHVVAAAGLDPRGLIVRWAHVLLGLAWLGSTAAYLYDGRLGWHPLLATAVLSLWYVPFGTVGGLIVLGTLLSRSPTL